MPAGNKEVFTCQGVGEGKLFLELPLLLVCWMGDGGGGEGIGGGGAFQLSGESEFFLKEPEIIENKKQSQSCSGLLSQFIDIGLFVQPREGGEGCVTEPHIGKAKPWSPELQWRGMGYFIMNGATQGNGG